MSLRSHFTSKKTPRYTSFLVTPSPLGAPPVASLDKIILPSRKPVDELTVRARGCAGPDNENSRACRSELRPGSGCDGVFQNQQVGSRRFLAGAWAGARVACFWHLSNHLPSSTSSPTPARAFVTRCPDGIRIVRPRAPLITGTKGVPSSYSRLLMSSPTCLPDGKRIFYNCATGYQ